MTDPRLAAAGYMPWAADPSGRTFLSPDGARLVSLEQAIAELDGKEPEAA